MILERAFLDSCPPLPPSLLPYQGPPVVSLAGSRSKRRYSLRVLLLMEDVLLISCRDSRFLRIFFRACEGEGGREEGRREGGEVSCEWLLMEEVLLINYRDSRFLRIIFRAVKGRKRGREGGREGGRGGEL